MTISQEPWVEIDPTVPECFLYEAVLIFLNGTISKFMQIDYPRRPSEAVTKISINMKMTISQEPSVEINPILCQNVSCVKPY